MMKLPKDMREEDGNIIVNLKIGIKWWVMPLIRLSSIYYAIRAKLNKDIEPKDLKIFKLITENGVKLLILPAAGNV